MDDMVVEVWSGSLLFLYISLLWPGGSFNFVQDIQMCILQSTLTWGDDPTWQVCLGRGSLWMQSAKWVCLILFAVANSCQSVNCVYQRIIQQGLMSFSGVLHLFAYSHGLPPIPTLPVKKKRYPTSYDSYEKDPDLPHRILIRWHVICYESFVCFGVFSV